MDGDGDVLVDDAPVAVDPMKADGDAHPVVHLFAMAAGAGHVAETMVKGNVGAGVDGDLAEVVPGDAGHVGEALFPHLAHGGEAAEDERWL